MKKTCLILFFMSAVAFAEEDLFKNLDMSKQDLSQLKEMMRMPSSDKKQNSLPTSELEKDLFKDIPGLNKATNNMNDTEKTQLLTQASLLDLGALTKLYPNISPKILEALQGKLKGLIPGH